MSFDEILAFPLMDVGSFQALDVNADGTVTLGECLGSDWTHDADTAQDWSLSLSELLRLVQFFNAGALHEQVGTEDGFAPGVGPNEGRPHSADYNDVDWDIGLSELLRTVQMFNAPAGVYHAAPSTEDGFASGYPE